MTDLLDQSTPSAEELDRIRAILDGYASRQATGETREGAIMTLRSDGAVGRVTLARPAPRRLVGAPWRRW